MPGKTMTLLELMAEYGGFDYISDLRFLSCIERCRLSRIIERQLPLETATLEEWNEALRYLTCAPPAQDAEAARILLLKQLRA